VQNALEKSKEELVSCIDAENIKANCAMKDHTTFKAGGPAALCVFPKNMAELFSALEVLKKEKVPFLVMGNGSNILFTDEGYPGAVVKLGCGLDRLHIEENIIFAEAGALLSAVAKAAAQAGLTGMEFASGIPGSLGGAVFMNAGAYGWEMKDIVHSVSSIARNGMMKDRLGKDLGFSYRKSIFQENGEVILGVKINLTPGDPVEIAEKTKEYAQRRASKQPMAQASAGSFFKRPEGAFAGKLIEEAGLKGLACGGAQVSPLHAGFIINTGDATAKDILDLMRIIQETVLDRFDILLEPEVRIVGLSEKL
jgi:UDP-N-acetylmuramate dehydrogenase